MVRLRLSSRILSLLPPQKTVVACPVDTASTQQSPSSEGEGFARDAMWEERTSDVLVRSKEDILGADWWVRALQG